MSRTETLTLLGEIVDQLSPIGGVARGTPLRSDDWNVMVDAMTRLARLIAAREQSLGNQLEEGFAPAKHAHMGEATLSWFEPETRKLLEGAANGAADTRIGQQRIDTELGALRSDIRALRNEMEGLRRSVDQLRDADFAREKSQGRLANDVQALRGIERGVDTLTVRLGGLDGSVAAVLAFRDQLRDPDGNVVDFRKLEGRVAGLEEIGEHLRTANGEIVRIREVESAIARLESGAIRRDEVDRVISDKVSAGGFLDDPALLDRVSERVRDGLEPRFERLDRAHTGLREDLGALDARVSPLTARLDAVDTRLSRQDTRIEGLDTLAPRLTQAEERLKGAEAGIAATQGTTDRVSALERSVDTLGTRVSGIEPTVARVTANASAIASLGTRTAALESATADLGSLRTRLQGAERGLQRIDALTLRVSRVETDLRGVATRVELAEAELKNLDGIGTRIDRLERSSAGFDEWRLATDRRLTQIGTGSSSGLVARVSALEERVADQNASIRRIETRQIESPVIRGGVPIGGGPVIR